MTNFNWIASFVLALNLNLVPVIMAENGCPANSESLPFHATGRYQFVVDVQVNHFGPFPFLLDTGTQRSILDSQLAEKLHQSMQGEVNLAGLGFNAPGSFTQVDSIGIGSQTVRDQKLIVYEVKNLLSANISIEGILGEDVLEQFEILIDNAHHVICVSAPGIMGREVRGNRVELLAPELGQDGIKLPESLIVSAKLSDGQRPLRLKLDSGANTPFLYNAWQVLALGVYRGSSWQGTGPNRTQRIFSALPAQDVKIGSARLSKVRFVTSVGAKKDARTSDFDGLLAMSLFRRVFISHAEHYVVLDPW
jgi:hypothetical protein